MRLAILALLLSACATLPCVDEHTGLALRECSAAESLTSPEWRVFAAHQQGVVDGGIRHLPGDNDVRAVARRVCIGAHRHQEPDHHADAHQSADRRIASVGRDR